MIGPSRVTYGIAQHRHQEHLDHSARIREIQQARQSGVATATRTTQRRLTAARLSSAFATVKAALHLRGERLSGSTTNG